MQRGIATAGRYPYKHMYALAGLFAQQQGISDEQVAVFAGSMAALRYAVLAFTSETRGLVMAAPSYEVPRQAAESNKAPVREVDLTADHAHDVPAMLAADLQAGMLYLCNPNNPTGTLTPTEAIRHALANKPKGSVLVVDEAYIDFSDAPSVVSWVKDHDDLLVLRTFSKIYGMAGARLGLAIGHPALLERLAVFGGDNVPAGSSLLGGLARPGRHQVAAPTQGAECPAARRDRGVAQGPWLFLYRVAEQLFHDRCETTGAAGHRQAGGTRRDDRAGVERLAAVGAGDGGQQARDGAVSRGVCGAGLNPHNPCGSWLACDADASVFQ